MTTIKIDRAHWRDFLISVTEDLVGHPAEAEIGYLALRRRIDAQWLSLFGLNYDPHTDTIEVALDGIDHVIEAPRALVADIGPAGLASLEVVAADRTSQIVRLRAPLPLSRRERIRASGR